jgi:hypothetical protein
MKHFLSLALAAFAWAAVVTPPGVRAALPQRGTLSVEGLRTYITRVGAKIDSSKGNLFVTSMTNGKARLEIRVLNDTAKQRVAFYAYGFGNSAGAPDPVALYEYLLKANSTMAIGTFFVDDDKDIGCKYMLDTRDPLSYETFEISYLAMFNNIKLRAPEIVKLAGRGGQQKPAEEPAEEPAQPPAGDGLTGLR